MLLNLLNDKLLFQPDAYNYKKNNIFSRKNLIFILLIESIYLTLITLSSSIIKDVLDKDYLELNLDMISSYKSIIEIINIY